MWGLYSENKSKLLGPQVKKLKYRWIMLPTDNNQQSDAALEVMWALS